MPIHDVGYRSWEGERTSQLSRWTVISETGIRLAAKSRWVRRILFVAWLPVMYWGFGFFFLEKSIEAEAGTLFSVENFDLTEDADIIGILKDEERIQANKSPSAPARPTDPEAEVDTEGDEEPASQTADKVQNGTPSTEGKRPPDQTKARRRPPNRRVGELLENLNTLKDELIKAKENLSELQENSPDAKSEIENAKRLVTELTAKIAKSSAEISLAQNARRRPRRELPMAEILQRLEQVEEELEDARNFLVDLQKNNPNDKAKIEAAKASIEELTAKMAQAAAAKQVRKEIVQRFAIFPHAEDLAAALESGDKDRIRNDIWRWLLMVFFRYPQSLLILLLIGTVAPALISRDLRSRAFLLYFSRPIGKLEYIFGKLCIPAAFIIAVTTLPAIALYFFAIAMSPSLSVIWSTWDIPIRIIGASIALVIPTSAIALMLSSLTQESRYANFSWFAVWALGHGAWIAIVLATAMRMGLPPIDRAVLESDQVKNWSVLSLYNCLGDVQEFIFGFEPLSNVWRGTLALTCITIFSLFILYRRVAAPVRV